MNKIAKKRTNRGDEKQLYPVNPINSKPKERKYQPPVISNEHLKKSTVKGIYRSEDNLAQGKHGSNIKMEDHPKKSRSKEKLNLEMNKEQVKIDYGDSKTIKEQGKIHKYIFHDDDSVALKPLHYSLDFKEGLLILLDPKKPINKRSYFILSSKEIRYNQIKEPEAFQLKVRKVDKYMVSDLVLKARSNSEKYYWMEEFGIKMNSSYELLKLCIREVENRRFRKGQKKRNETQEMKDVDIGTLLRALDGQVANKVNLTNDRRWNVGRIEKLIQVLLNEIPQPLVPYQLQDILEKSTPKTLQRDYAKILKRLPVDSHKMLQMLIEHLENLTNYYVNQLNANLNETEKIRRNICARLTPLIIRQDFIREQDMMGTFPSGYDENSTINKFCTMFYKLMETSDFKGIAQ